MTNKVGIDVGANLDTSGIEQSLNALGQKVAQANKVQFTPVSVKSIDDVNKLVKQFDQLLKVQTELQKRIKATGQTGKGMLDLDFSQIYPDQNVRAKQMRKIMEYTVGPGIFHGGVQVPGGKPAPGVTPPPAPAHPPASGPGIGTAVGHVAQAGLRAAGPVGGVAAGALGTGMSAGFGAGLGGLLGGLAALGVGKLVGAVTENVEKAEAENVAMDRLKRTLGDVNVSFDALKSVVHAGADNLRITYAEAAKLSDQFVRLGNVSASQYNTLADEVQTGTGLSRGFGLDPSEGVGVLGRMRGMGVTTDTQESRRFALLIGETIGKAGAFAKADEVMDAIAGFAESQTRASLGTPNVANYAGALSGLVGSGIPGLDPRGAASLLAKVNASLTAGGAKGEASQFFTAMVGDRMGLDPVQTQILREGGAFASTDEAFGKDSIATKFGIKGPKGGTSGKTFLQGSMEALREQYGDDPGMLAQATANHLGTSMRHAMALLTVKPNEMGEMQKYGDLTKFSESGIGNLSKALHGTADDRQALSRSMLGRADVAEEDKAQIRGAGTDAALKPVLAELAAKYGQERTQGTDIRDSKNALDNIKTALADKLVPLTTDIRLGIMEIAGKGTKTSQEVMRGVVERDSEGRRRSISGDFDPRLTALRATGNDLRYKISELSETKLTGSAKYLNNPELAAEKRRERQDLERQLAENDQKIADLSAEKAKLLAKENARRDAEIKRMDDEAAKRALTEVTTEGPATHGDFVRQERAAGAPGVAPGAAGSKTRRTGVYNTAGVAPATSTVDTTLPPEARGLLDTISTAEGAGYQSLVGQGRNNASIGSLDQHPNTVGLVTERGPSTAAGRYQITGTTWKRMAAKMGVKDFSEESQDKVAWQLAQEDYKRRTGRDLLPDLKSDDPKVRANIGSVLSPTWTSLPGGVEQRQKSDVFGGNLDANIKRNSEKKAPVKPPVDASSPFGGMAGARDALRVKTPGPGEDPAAVEARKKSREDMQRELQRSKGTTLPDGGKPPGGEQQSFRLQADPITVTHVLPNGQQYMPDQTVQTRVRSNWNYA